MIVTWKKITLNNMSIYLYTNLDVSVATWSTNSIEFNVMSDLNMKEFKQIFEESFGGT